MSETLLQISYSLLKAADSYLFIAPKTKEYSRLRWDSLLSRQACGSNRLFRRIDTEDRSRVGRIWRYFLEILPVEKMVVLKADCVPSFCVVVQQAKPRHFPFRGLLFTKFAACLGVTVLYQVESMQRKKSLLAHQRGLGMAGCSTHQVS